MLRKLGEDRFVELKDKALKTFPLIAAVLEGSQSGTVFVDDEVRPRSVFIISKSGFSFLRTANPDFDYGGFTRFLVESPAIPQYLHIYDPHSALTDYVKARPGEFGIKLRTRIQLQYRKEEINPEAFRTAFDTEAVEISGDNIASLAPLGLHIENKFWDSGAHFLEKGYGLFLKSGAGDPMAVCYAAAVGNGLAEVDILTAPDHQKKGLAKYATALFICQGLQKSIRTNWDCFEDNAGSLNTALALKFTAVKNYPLLSLFLKERL